MSASFVYLDENNNLSTTNSTLSGLFPDTVSTLNVELEYKNKFLFGTTASDNIKVGNLSIKEVDINKDTTSKLFYFTEKKEMSGGY